MMWAAICEAAALGWALRICTTRKRRVHGRSERRMLRDMGCSYVILGHSERRQLMGESDAVVNKKVFAALRSELTRSFASVRRWRSARGSDQAVIATQMKGSLAKLSSDQGQKLVIAYEPVWAIGLARQPLQPKPKRCTRRFVCCSTISSVSPSQIRFESNTAAA